MSDLISMCIFFAIAYLFVGLLGYMIVDDCESDNYYSLSTYLLFWPVMFIISSVRGFISFLRG